MPSTGSGCGIEMVEHSVITSTGIGSGIVMVEPSNIMVGYRYKLSLPVVES